MDGQGLVDLAMQCNKIQICADYLCVYHVHQAIVNHVNYPKHDVDDKDVLCLSFFPNAHNVQHPRRSKLEAQEVANSVCS